MKVSVKTWGCSNNFSESEAIAGQLEKAGYEVSDSDSDIMIFNMCSVKGPSVKACLGDVNDIVSKFPEKKVVVAGCVPRELISDLKSLSPNVSVVGTHHIDRIAEVVSSNEQVSFSAFDKKVKLNIPKKRLNPVVGIVPISSGCNDHCTYCSTVLIKGPNVSYPEDLILDEVKTAVSEGCKEIWLTSQDNGAYMTEHGSVGLPELIKKVSNIDGDFFIRVGMANPTYLFDCVNDLVASLKHSKVFKFLHIPIQSGNDKVLKDMKRRYTVEQCRKLFSKLRSEIPDLTLSTDIICGFPDESDEEFQDTLDFVSEIKFDIINISRFQSRNGTLAASMPNQVHGSVSKERSRLITELFRSYSLENNKKLINKEFEVVISDKGPSGDCIGHNLQYKQVIIKEDLPLGSVVNVKIVSADIFHVIGEVLS